MRSTLMQPVRTLGRIVIGPRQVRNGYARIVAAANGAGRIELYDAGGSLVRTLLDETRGPGSHSIEWDGTDRAGRSVASGVYFARFQVNGALVDTHKMMLLK